ncbi:hypothetical protein RM780_20250 [Streptomyces sp. DSM 44917]|uniref:Uncharacterized protein n=1 Tax=Streptomyces boetiae TaxID=3075541 RepID=A0ABU2LCH0_9ACTN|nr:hypothetical protein [Streptomyces sp. DSM 44917]MDT0309274.1 hypothetical protein [Streptomyces sp. DSM 44917]
MLPWPGADGAPAFLAPDAAGRLTQLADEVEAAQLGTATEVLRYARALITEPGVTARELQFAALRLAECLTDALRIAESRGARLADGGAR